MHVIHCSSTAFHYAKLCVSRLLCDVLTTRLFCALASRFSHKLVESNNKIVWSTECRIVTSSRTINPTTFVRSAGTPERNLYKVYVKFIYVGNICRSIHIIAIKSNIVSCHINKCVQSLHMSWRFMWKWKRVVGWVTIV